MSLVRPAVNAWLRRIEKPFLARATDVDHVRRGFEQKARLFFQAPLGTRMCMAPQGGVSCLDVRPRRAAQTPLILYFHGGAYVFGSPRTHAAMLAALAREAGGTALLPAYRKAPEHPFPAAVDDALAVWRALLAEGHDPRGIVIGGDSAGGGLALALLAELLAQKLPRPAGVFAFSPLTDLTFSGGSVTANVAADVLLPAHRAGDMVRMYLGGAPATTPRASPLFAAFAGAPPVWLTVGDTEILLDDTRRLNDKLTAAGVQVTCRIERDLPHVWPIFHNVLPEARATLRHLAAWIRTRTDLSGES